jgi:hypothetical protein
VSFTYGVAFNRHLISCLGTRIRWDGSHVRNTYDGSCPGGGVAAARAARVPPDLEIGGVPVDRYITDKQLRAFDRACLAPGATERSCRRAAMRLLWSLPSKVRREIKPVACAAMSERAWDRLAPKAGCAS